MACSVHVRSSQNHMATTFHFCIACDYSYAHRASRVLDEALAWVGELEHQLSEYLTTSPIYKLNQSEAFCPVAMSTDAIELFELAHTARVQSNGLFDISAKTPASAAFPRISWDRHNGSAWKTHAAVHIGFGAIGKGYALDRVRLLLEQNGFRDYQLSAGGSSWIFSGFAGPGHPWTWGWSWSSDEDGNPLGTCFQNKQGDPIALGISGTHEKGNHLIHPLLCENEKVLSASGQLKSALVASPSAALSDAFSTALFVSQGDHLNKYGAAAIIDSENIPHWNFKFQSTWGQPSVQSENASRI